MRHCAEGVCAFTTKLSHHTGSDVARAGQGHRRSEAPGAVHSNYARNKAVLNVMFGNAAQDEGK
jgi:hypothetical protein